MARAYGTDRVCAINDVPSCDHVGSFLQLMVTGSRAACAGALSRGAPLFVFPHIYNSCTGIHYFLGPGRSLQIGHVEWRLGREMNPDDVTLVHATVVDNPAKVGKLRFVQWTVRITSQQYVAAYNKKGKLVAGDPSKPLSVEDYWVFERPVIRSWFIPKSAPQDATWRLVGRLSFPPLAAGSGSGSGSGAPAGAATATASKA